METKRDPVTRMWHIHCDGELWTQFALKSWITWLGVYGCLTNLQHVTINWIRNQIANFIMFLLLKAVTVSLCNYVLYIQYFKLVGLVSKILCSRLWLICLLMLMLLRSACGLVSDGVAPTKQIHEAGYCSYILFLPSKCLKQG